ncbi:hypothetical protein AGMMS50249_4170 [candidate division SR1 bacterium]|nr:hypothetical protein AGMMS50249_4170 [candidate division SR1 bacterium]
MKGEAERREAGGSIIVSLSPDANIKKIDINMPKLARIIINTKRRYKLTCELRIANCELRIANCELRIANCELRIANCELVCQVIFDIVG